MPVKLMIPNLDPAGTSDSILTIISPLNKLPSVPAARFLASIQVPVELTPP